MWIHIKKFVHRFPVLFSFIIVAIVSILTEIRLEPLFLGFMDQQSASYTTGFLEQGICSILMVLLLVKLDLLRSAGFTKPKEWKQVWLIWPLAILSVMNAWSLVSGEIILNMTDTRLLVLFFLLFLSVGFVEEVLLRGVVLNVFLKKWGNTKKGMYLSVIISSAIFGILHLLNFFTGRYDLLSAILQLVYGIFFGVFFSACFIRNQSIWPVMIGHIVFDICGNFNEIAVNSEFGKVVHITPENALSTLVVTLPLLIYGLFILRKVQLPNMFQTLANSEREWK